MLKKLYEYFLKLARSPNALYFLAILSFAESSFFPIPPDVLLIPIALANPKKAYFAATVCSAASVLGGIFGYGIGYFLKDSVAMPLVHYFNAENSFAWFSEKYLAYGALIVFAAGFTPIPYKIATIASGVVGMNFLMFVLMSSLSRSLRFFLIAALLNVYGERARVFIEKHLGILSFVFLFLLIGCFYLFF